MMAAAGAAAVALWDEAGGASFPAIPGDSGLALPMVEDCISLVDLATARIVVHTGFAEPS